jgi:phage tail protein X|tara:strand:+ start:664 stop:963 length:300 start_codon:yes stop_codon:yes gene_type:complete
MRRYDNIQIIKKEGERKFTETVVYPVINPSINDTYIITKEGDRLDNLAWEYYRDPSLWWIIARANNIGKGTLFPEVGVQLRIPDDVESLQNEYAELNNV